MQLIQLTTKKKKKQSTIKLAISRGRLENNMKLGKGEAVKSFSTFTRYF